MREFGVAALLIILLDICLWIAVRQRSHRGCRRESFKEAELSDERQDAKVVHSVKSNRHTIEVIDTGNGKLGQCVLIDDKVQVCDRDEHVYHEMLVHFPSMYVGTLKRVLIAGGGDCMALREVLKYDTITDVVVIEDNEHLISVSETQLMMSAHRQDSRVRWMVGEPGSLVQKLQAQKQMLQSFDLIIVDGKERPGASPYDSDFLKNAHLLLAHTGVLVRNGGRHAAQMQAAFPNTLSYSFHSETHDSKYTMVLGADFDLIKHKIDTDRLTQRKVSARFYKPDAHFSHIPWFAAMKIRGGVRPPAPQT